MSDGTQSQINPFAAQQRLLIERLHIFLVTLHSDLYADVVHALEADGKLFALQHAQDDESRPQQITGSWGLLTLLVAQMVTLDIDLAQVGSVAIATECFICALDLLDDVEDEDQTPTLQRLGVARTLNVATALLMLAQQALLSIPQYQVPSERVLLLLNTLQICAIVATNGQHRDLLAEQQPASAFTKDDCIEIARGKAGALMRLAFLLGAICAGADDSTCEQFASVGELLGIAHQLDNDTHDLYYLLQRYSADAVPTGAGDTDRGIKSDLARGKKTLPVVLAAQQEAVLQENAPQADEQKQEHLRALQDGIITTWGISLLYRERARDILQEIERRLPVSPLLHLLLGL